MLGNVVVYNRGRFCDRGSRREWAGGCYWILMEWSSVASIGDLFWCTRVW